MISSFERLLGIWYRTTTRERDAGRDWYPNARAFCDSVAFWTDAPLERVIGACAALSPRTDWNRNKLLTEKLFKREPFVWTSAQLNKARAIAFGRAPVACAFSRRTCPKTLNFYHNILRPDDARYVTIDSHAAQAAGVIRSPREKFDYWPVARVYLDCARYVGEVPNAFQATIWNWQRTNGQMELGL